MEIHTRLLYALEDIVPEKSVDGIIANSILRCIKNKESINLKKISKEAYVSNATINRFCKRLKLTGFKELKTYFELEKMSVYENSDEKYNKNPNYVYVETWNNNVNEIIAWKEANKFLSKRVHILTTSNLSNISKILEEGLREMDYDTSSFIDEYWWNKSSAFNPDIVICITISGDRKKIVDFIKESKKMKKNTKFILVSSMDVIKDFAAKEDLFLSIIGDSRKNKIPNIITRRSIISIFDLLLCFFTKEKKIDLLTRIK